MATGSAILRRRLHAYRNLFTFRPTTESAYNTYIRVTARTSPPALSLARGWSVAVVATLVMSVSYIDRQALAALAPTVCKALAIDHEQYGWVLAAFSLAYLVGAPVSGALLDHLGARRGLVYAILAWSAVAAVQAVVPGFVTLVAMRIALGLAESPSFPGAAQSVQRVLPRASRSAGYGMLFTGSAVGAMVAAPLASALYARWGWRFAFVGTAIVGLAWVPLWLATTSRADVQAALATPPEAPAGEPPSRLALVLTPPVLRAVLMVLAAAPSIMFGLNFMAHFLHDVYALPQDALGAYLWVPPLFYDLGSVGFGVLASRRERHEGEPRSHAGLMAAAAALAVTMAAMPLAHHSPALANALAATSLAGGGGLYALLTSDMLKRVHPTQVSTAGGLTAAAQSLAFIVAGPLIGRVYDRTHSYAGLLVGLGAIVVPMAAVWCLWPVRAPASAR